LTQTFKNLDKNNDGVLSKQELLDGLNKTNIYMSKKEIDELF